MRHHKTPPQTSKMPLREQYRPHWEVLIQFNSLYLHFAFENRGPERFSDYTHSRPPATIQLISEICLIITPLLCAALSLSLSLLPSLRLPLFLLSPLFHVPSSDFSPLPSVIIPLGFQDLRYSDPTPHISSLIVYADLSPLHIKPHSHGHSLSLINSNHKDLECIVLFPEP